MHADDLASALSRLHARAGQAGGDTSSMSSPTSLREGESGAGPGAEGGDVGEFGSVSARRQRSGSSTIVYHPEDHGHSPDLPAISVEDTTESPGDLTPMEGVEGPDEKKFFHTSRPPVELMSDA